MQLLQKNQPRTTSTDEDGFTLSRLNQDGAVAFPGLAESSHSSEALVVTGGKLASSSVKLIHEVNIDEELIATLEQILAFDSSRDDIRFKLFELYLVAKQFTRAQASYLKLDSHLDRDDKLRLNLQEVCSKYAFNPDNIARSDFPDAEPEVAKSEASEGLNHQLTERTIEFVSRKASLPVTLKPASWSEEATLSDFAEQRVIDFNQNSVSKKSEQPLDKAPLAAPKLPEAKPVTSIEELVIAASSVNFDFESSPDVLPY